MKLYGWKMQRAQSYIDHTVHGGTLVQPLHQWKGDSFASEVASQFDVPPKAHTIQVALHSEAKDDSLECTICGRNSRCEAAWLQDEEGDRITYAWPSDVLKNLLARGIDTVYVTVTYEDDSA